MFDAREIANFFLDYADSRNIQISNLSMQKIVYYAHGWHLAKYDAPLVSNKFEAWDHGPVISILYDAFKQAGDAPIKNRATRFDIVVNGYAIANGNFDEPLKIFLIQIFEFYGRIGPYELSRMTHEQGGPWDQVSSAGKKEVCLRMEIPNNIIKRHFSHAQMNAT